MSILKKDLVVLALTDLVMFLATFFCVLLQKAVFYRWISWNSVGWKLQHVRRPSSSLLPSSPYGDRTCLRCLFCRFVVAQFAVLMVVMATHIPVFRNWMGLS